MTRHSEEHFSPHPPATLFGLVADIERYPEFLPWCQQVVVLERGKNRWVAEMRVNFKGLSEAFVSEVLLHPGKKKTDPCAIEVTLLKGPFHHLSNHWRFLPEKAGRKTGTRILFEIDFQFKSLLLDKMIGFVFDAAMRKMVSAFEKRAEEIAAKGGIA